MAEIAIDFDGTCVTHAYPLIGEDIGAVPVLAALSQTGHRFILFTMRSAGKLQEAIDWFTNNGIPLYSIQVNPTQSSWTSSNKAYAQLYIDDAALGAPLTFNRAISNRPFYDWQKAKHMLQVTGYLPLPVGVMEQLPTGKYKHIPFKPK